MSNLTAVGAGQPKSWDDNLPGRESDSETCAACCQALDSVRVLPIHWVEHAFAPVVVSASAAVLVNARVATKRGNQP
jgi:hypothetical protein